MSKLDYYVGQRFDKLDAGEDVGDWSLSLSGKAKITNLDPDLPPPDPEILEGKVLLSVDDCALNFGHYEGQGEDMRGVVDATVELASGTYTVSDPVHTKGTQVQPESWEHTDDTPPDPSAERVADGPDKPVEATESAPKPKRTRRKVKDAPQA